MTGRRVIGTLMHLYAAALFRVHMPLPGSCKDWMPRKNEAAARLALSSYSLCRGVLNLMGNRYGNPSVTSQHPSKRGA
eukprot:1157302-Pelagomonas_calceolata.AAC.5